MKIEVICASREIFGSDRSAVRLARLLGSMGHEAKLRVPHHRPDRGLSSLARRHDVEVDVARVTVASRGGLRGIEASFQLPSQSADLAIYNSMAAVPVRPHRTPSALIVREWLRPESRRHRVLAALHRRRTDAVIAVSSGVANQWSACAGAGPPTSVIWNWLDEEWLMPGAPDPSREGIVFAGRLNSWKGQMLLADAYERAFDGARTRPSLTFVGAEGKASPFFRNVAPLESRCRRSGSRLLPQRGSVRELFRRSALVVVPSLRPEPFGNVILEALASGCRVVAFPGGGPDDIAPLFPEAVEIAPRNEEALASSLARWWRAGGYPQSGRTHRRVNALLKQLFSENAARALWGQVIERLTGEADAFPLAEEHHPAPEPRRRVRASRQLARTH